MKRIEPNMILAITTAFALMLMVVTASLYASTTTTLKYVGLAIACSAGFVLLNKAFMAARKRKPRVLISAEHPGVVMYTLVDGSLRDQLKMECAKRGLPCIAVLSGVVAELSNYLGVESHASPGKQHELNEDYFTRVDAINYALAHDDGQAHWELDEADVVIVGVSRTSKSPTCVYLAYKGLKTANIPFVLDCPLPPYWVPRRENRAVFWTMGINCPLHCAQPLGAKVNENNRTSPRKGSAMEKSSKI